MVFYLEKVYVVKEFVFVCGSMKWLKLVRKCRIGKNRVTPIAPFVYETQFYSTSG